MPIAMRYLLGSSHSFKWVGVSGQFFFYCCCNRGKKNVLRMIFMQFHSKPRFQCAVSKLKWTLRAIRSSVFYDDDKSWTWRIIHLLTEHVCKRIGNKTATNRIGWTFHCIVIQQLTFCWIFFFYYLHNKM